MARPLESKRAQAMYDRYLEGESLARVGAAFGVRRQTVFDAFKRRSWPMRSPRRQEKVQFNGEAYTPDPDGYYRKTTGDRGWLHHAVWEYHLGPIPRGRHIHHRDGDQGNNALENLACVKPGDHTRTHHPFQAFDRPSCLWCGTPLRRRRQPSGRFETPAEVKRRMYCNTCCQSDHKRGKPRGWSPREEAEAR